MNIKAFNLKIVESEGFEPSSREGNYRIFYMLIPSLVVGKYPEKDTQVQP